VAVIINKKNLTHEFVSQSKLFGVSILEEAAPLAFFGPFGFRSGRDYDKLSKVQFKEGTTGCPLVTQYTLSVLEAKVIEQIDVGTHTVFIGDVVSSEVLKEGAPLTYLYYREKLKGKSSQNSPTYIPPK
jgi:flavin reductase (DIM6/NTAB) family NADH-FMN oxidoreductase RutF